MKKLIVLAALALAACGADGEPVKPTGGVNVNVGPNGVRTSASVGAKAGPVNVRIGL
ncbi:hypothetical protein [Nereida sp. MMG025]|uniref:hypothetical protein n=1 Tax=Nereida sp. MMG025 TaxID=2909981 RepID=UPI001F15A2C7|nr:hypothetical protein [Nereida sp. MMG025]MCF6444349.1 hypothetical protein [Nereida sp. MMG025]